ncbi:MAG: hypothetical protein K2N73_10395 [Lachnospiraceae bacterium]|nr:hypothetical protein [Lachnospiraceae bacterium]
MANPLMGMMGGTPAAGMNMGMVQQMQQAMGMLRAMKNPQQALQMIAQQNPESASILQMAQGRNPVEIFREECQKHGKDPDQMMKMLGLTPPKGC